MGIPNRTNKIWSKNGEKPQVSLITKNAATGNKLDQLPDQIETLICE